MKNRTAVWLMAAIFAAGCSYATLDARPGDYRVTGSTRRPEAAIAVSSQALVNETNAREYWKAETENRREYWRSVREGRLYPYMGGHGSDYGYYFGGLMIPQMHVAGGEASAVNTPVEESAASGEPPPEEPHATKRELRKVEKTANAAHRKASKSIEYHKRLRKVLSGEGSQ